MWLCILKLHFSCVQLFFSPKLTIPLRPPYSSTDWEWNLYLFAFLFPPFIFLFICSQSRWCTLAESLKLMLYFTERVSRCLSTLPFPYCRLFAVFPLRAMQRVEMAHFSGCPELALISIKLMGAVTLMIISALDWEETKHRAVPAGKKHN